jgi:hypothetical protein
MKRFLKTRKLFYGKYPYKVCCFIKGSYLISRCNSEEIRNFCEDLENKNPHYNWWNKDLDKKKLLEFYETIKPFLDKNLKFRTQNTSFDIYLDNPQLFKELSSTLDPWIIEIHQPATDQELTILTSQNKKIVCDKLPYNKFQYKVYLKYRANIEVRQRFKTWVTQYVGKVQYPKAVNRWLDTDSRWPWDPIIYVSDKNTLVMVGLFLGSDVRKVEEFILRSNINTEVNQETPCQL